MSGRVFGARQAGWYRGVYYRYFVPTTSSDFCLSIEMIREFALVGKERC